MDQAISSLVNGKPESQISIYNRGFRYGDGLFETMAVKNKLPEMWDSHYQRLKLGCARLKIDNIPESDTLLSELRSICPKEGKYIARITITRQATGRAYRVHETLSPLRLVSLFPWPKLDDTSAGIRLQSCEHKLASSSILAGLKHLNRLDQVLASLEIDYDNYDEGIVSDFSEQIISGTMSNLFCVSAGVLQTPNLEQGGIEGTMRALVLQTANLIGIESAIKSINIDELRNAEEVFMTNSLWSIKPVRQLNEIKFECPGVVTKKLLKHVNIKLGRN